jgi:hypothetical protein
MLEFVGHGASEAIACELATHHHVQVTVTSCGNDLMDEVCGKAGPDPAALFDIDDHVGAIENADEVAKRRGPGDAIAQNVLEARV